MGLIRSIDGVYMFYVQITKEDDVMFMNKAHHHSVRFITLVLIAAFVLCMIVGNVAVFAQEPVDENSSEPAVQDGNLPVDKAVTVLNSVIENRVFRDDLKLEDNTGILDAVDFTGPFLVICNSDGSPYVPDIMAERIKRNIVPPDNTQIVPAGEDEIPGNYLSLLQSPEKTSAVLAGEKPMVFALLEYIGYSSAGEYSGGFEVYNYSSRVSFYSGDTGEMLGWAISSEYHSGPMLLNSNDYINDGQRPVLKINHGTPYSDKRWTNALDELFYDENLYQVRGNELLSVPDDVDPVVVPDGVTQISNMVGHFHTATEVILPDGLEKIGYAFFSNSAMEKVNVPDSVIFCGRYVFSDTPWMESHENDDWVIVGDGVLLDCNVRDEELVISPDVKYIAPEALSYLPCRKITIPSTVIECYGGISDSPIMYSDSIEEIVLEGGLDSAVPGEGPVVAAYCDNLKFVTVDCETDTLLETWLKVRSDCLDNLTIICPNGSPAAQWANDFGVAHKETRD